MQGMLSVERTASHHLKKNWKMEVRDAFRLIPRVVSTKSKASTNFIGKFSSKSPVEMPCFAHRMA
jgi:hypothetical protein